MLAAAGKSAKASAVAGVKFDETASRRMGS